MQVLCSWCQLLLIDAAVHKLYIRGPCCVWVLLCSSVLKFQLGCLFEFDSMFAQFLALIVD